MSKSKDWNAGWRTGYDEGSIVASVVLLIIFVVIFGILYYSGELFNNDYNDRTQLDAFQDLCHSVNLEYKNNSGVCYNLSQGRVTYYNIEFVAGNYSVNNYPIIGVDE